MTNFVVPTMPTDIFLATCRLSKCCQKADPKVFIIYRSHYVTIWLCEGNKVEIILVINFLGFLCVVVMGCYGYRAQ